MSGRDLSCGLVLSGGGAYAAYEVGVVRALVTGASPVSGFRPVDPGVITGTSAGSFNAALFASAPSDDAGAAIRFVEDFWRRRIAEQPGQCTGNVIRFRGNALGFLNPACLVHSRHYATEFADDLQYLTAEWSARGGAFLNGPGTLRQRAIEAFDLATLVSASPLRELLARALCGDRIVTTSREIRIATTNWRTGEARVFRNDEMHADRALRVVMASSAIPGVFPSVEIDGDPLVDGGVVMNTPLLPAIEAGSTALHVVYMDPDARHVPLPRVRNTLNTLYRMLVISFGLVVSRDIATAAAINGRIRRDPTAAFTTAVTDVPRAREYAPLTIHGSFPADDLGGTFRWLDFDSDHIDRLILRGYEDACHHDCGVNRCIVAEDVGSGAEPSRVAAGRAHA